MKKDIALCALSAGCGILVWVIIANAFGRREAWDSPMYFKFGLPACYLLSFIFGTIEPRRSWRWGICPFVGQFGWMLTTQGAGSLLPLGMILMGVLSIPGVIAAKIGAAFAK